MFSTNTRTRNRNQGMIKPKDLMPVQITSCEEGLITRYGSNTVRFSFRHLQSLEVFNSTVFENTPPAYVSDQIVDAVLPPDVDYTLEDLIGKGLMIEVAFKQTEKATFINVVRATPLAKEFQTVLHDLQEADKQEFEKQQERQAARSKEFDDMLLDEEEEDDLQLDDLDTSRNDEESDLEDLDSLDELDLEDHPNTPRKKRLGWTGSTTSSFEEEMQTHDQPAH